MLGFLLKKTLGYEEGEICILMTCFLEHAIERLLHLFPNRIAVWPDDHAALHWGIVRQFRCGNDVGIPPGVVFGALADLRFGHNLHHSTMRIMVFGAL